MKYCSHCGNQILDEAVICVHCGCSTDGRIQSRTSQSDNTLETVIKVFLIIGCVSFGWMLLPLAWCIPMTVTIFKKLNNNEPIGMGLKICTLLFVNIVAGICLLCRND